MAVNVSGRVPSGVTRRRIADAVFAAFAVSRRKPSGAVAVRFVTDGDIATLNRRYRGIRTPTDVLSFSADEMPSVGHHAEREWGDIVIASTYAGREAKRQGVKPAEEIIRLVAHGALHLLGFDHATATAERRMFSLQERVVGRMFRV